MKICPSCYRCYEDGETSCALEPSIKLVHERDGTRIIDDKYRLDHRLGRGGNGAVYKCTHIELDQPRAVKLLLPDAPDSDPNRRLRLRREALTACRFEHPNVVRVYDFGTNVISAEEDGKIKTYGELYIVMEFVDGETLKEFLKEKKPIPVEEAVTIALQISDGLAEVHGQGVILRDLKPENVMLTRDRRGNMQVKLVDFGAVKLSGQAVEHVNTDLTHGMFIGTALYASPELCKGESLDERSDIYGLGIILYEMLAGHPPFPPSGLPDLLYKHAYAPPPPLENAPAPLTYLVARALSKDLEERPQSAAEFADSLRDFGRSIALPPPATTKAPLATSSDVERPGNFEAAGEDEETRVAAVALVRNSHEPNLISTQVGIAGDNKVFPPRPSQRVKANTKRTGRTTFPKSSGPTAEGRLGKAAQEKVINKKGLAVAEKTSKRRAGLDGGLRTLTAVILILSSLAASIFLIWRLGQDISPDAPPVEASENSDKPAPPSFTSEVGDELITKTDVNIRERPSGKSERIGLAEKGSRVRILAKRKNWREIVVLEHGREKEDSDSTDQGWIDGDNLTVADDGG